MKQYTYSAISPKGKADLIRCTAAHPQWARLQIQCAYEGWTVAALFCDIDEPHKTLGEIDASDMTADDYHRLAQTGQHALDLN